MVTITEANGLMDKKKEEVYKFTMKKDIDMKENGKPIYRMVKGKSLIGMGHIILVGFRITIGMERDNFMILRTKRQFNSFTKMVFFYNKKQNQYKCRKNNNFQH